MGRNDSVFEVVLRVHHETAKAFLVSEDGDKENAVWLPKSLCECGERKAAATFEFTMPEWLAVDKGFAG